SGPLFAPDVRLTTSLVTKIVDEALGLAELGGRMVDAARLDRLRGAARRLEDAGLGPLATLVGRLATADETERPLRLLAVVHAAAMLRTVSRRLPILLPQRRGWL